MFRQSIHAAMPLQFDGTDVDCCLRLRRDTLEGAQKRHANSSKTTIGMFKSNIRMAVW